MTSCDQQPTSCNQQLTSCDLQLSNCDQLLSSCDQLLSSCDQLLSSCDQLPGSLLLLEPGHHLAALLVLGLHRAPLLLTVTTSIISQLVTWPIFCLTCSSSSSTRGVWWNLAASTRGVKPHLSLSRGLTPHPATRNCTQWV